MGADLTKAPSQTVLTQSVIAQGRSATSAPSVPAQPQPPRIEAAVEGLRDGKLVGWVWLPDVPSDELSVDLYEGMQLLDRRTANEFRPALEQSGKRGGRCGFSFQLPASLLDGRAHSLTVRLTDGGTNLPNGTVQFGPLQVSTLVDEVVALRQAVERLTRIVEENFTADGKLPTELVRTLSDRVASFAEIQRDLVERELDALRAMAFAQAQKQQAQFPSSPHIAIRQAMQAAAQGVVGDDEGEAIGGKANGGKDAIWRRPGGQAVNAKAEAKPNGASVHKASHNGAGLNGTHGAAANGTHVNGTHPPGLKTNGALNGASQPPANRKAANGKATNGTSAPAAIPAPKPTETKSAKPAPGKPKTAKPKTAPPKTAKPKTAKPKPATQKTAKPNTAKAKPGSGNGAGRHAAAKPGPVRAIAAAAKRGVKQLSRRA